MNNKLFFLIIGILLYLTCVVLIRLYTKYAHSKGFLDIPGPRSSHQIPMPRGAGIIFTGLWILVLLIGWITSIFSFYEFFTLVPGVIIVAILGYWDDLKTLSPSWRLWGQILAACLFLLAVGNLDNLHLFSKFAIPLGGIAGVLILVMIVWFINLFNFMDGIDGLASIEAIFVLGFGGLIFWLSGVMSLALIAWAMTILVVGFLVWNWPKADIFMGDVGSYVLGFLIAGLAIVGDVWYDIPIVLWFILFAVFLFDATITLLRRIVHKKNWMQPHREHAYQRLQQSGFSTVQVLLLIIIINCLLAGLAMLGYYYPNYIPVFLVAAIIIVGLQYWWVEKRQPQTTIVKN